MNGNLKWLRENWVILTFFASLIVGWTTLKKDTESNVRLLEKHDSALLVCQTFISVQTEVNKKIDTMDRKIDRLLRR